MHSKHQRRCSTAEGAIKGVYIVRKQRLFSGGTDYMSLEIVFLMPHNSDGRGIEHDAGTACLTTRQTGGRLRAAKLGGQKS
jgi:hypothetical protein